jgi:hypothetical protein
LEQLRIWARRAPVWQRVTAGTGGALVLVLVATLMFPVSSKPAGTLGVAAGAGTAPTAGGPAAGTDTTLPPTDATAAPGAATPAAGGAVGQPGKSAPTRCTAPPGTDQGLSATEMKVAIILIELKGSFVNSLTGTPSVEDQRADYDAIVDGLNTRGGIACHKIVPVYFRANPIDSTSLQQVCLEITQAHPFFVVDSGTYFLYPQLTACYADHQVPVYTPGLLPLSTQRAKYPYLFGGGLMEVVHRNMVLALGQRGWFGAGNGFKKLGLLYRSCNAQLPGELMAWTAQAGVPASAIVKHDAGCPAATAPPSDLQQAVLDFKTAGVTHVVMAEDDIDFANFTLLAERQGFRPKYAVPAVQIGQTYATQHPDYDNIVDTISISQLRQGEERTPGMAPTGATAFCDSILVAHKRPPTYQAADALAGNFCDVFLMLKGAAEHAPALARNALAAGLQATHTIDLSFPMGPADFSSPYTTYAGQMWRVAQYFPSCTCWRVVDQTFHPSFR